MRVTLVTICLLLLATGALAQSDRGTITGAVNDPNGAVVARAEVEEAWARWAAAGVNHHSSATPGDLSGPVSAVARLLGIEAVIV